MLKKALILSSFLLLSTGTVCFGQDANYDAPGQNMGMPTQICTITSEPCKFGEEGGAISGAGQMARYRCCVSSRSGFVDFVASIYKYIFFISLLLGVVLIVVMGILMSFSGLASTEELRDSIKKRIIAIIFGLMVLGLIPWILKTIAPFFFE